MNGKQILQQAFAEHTAETGTRVVDHAFLTRGPGTGKLVVNAVTRRVYYYQLTATGDVRATGTAVVSTALYIDFVDDTRYENQMVDLGYEPGDPDTLKVLRLNNTFGIAGVGGVTPGEQAIHASNFPSSANIVDLRSQPTAPASSEVQVSAGAYLDDIGAIELVSTDLTANATNSLTSQIATLASGKHAVCWLCLDISTGILDTVLGTPVTASGALPSRREFNSPAAFNSIAVANPLRRIVPVYLYHGQTEVVEAGYYRAYDARHPFNAGISASGGSGDVIGPATATQHAAPRFDGANGKLL